jgi:hypothetical protein
MSQAVAPSERSYALEVPFHGRYEGYAKVYSALSAAFALVDMAMPWIGFHRKPGIHFVRGFTVDVMCVSVMLTYQTVYKRLSGQISLGGADAGLLDRIRLQVATMVMNLLILGLILWSVGIFLR